MSVCSAVSVANATDPSQHIRGDNFWSQSDRLAESSLRPQSNLSVVEQRRTALLAKLSLRGKRLMFRFRPPFQRRQRWDSLRSRRGVVKCVRREALQTTRNLVSFPPLPKARPRDSDGSRNIWMDSLVRRRPSACVRSLQDAFMLLPSLPAAPPPQVEVPRASRHDRPSNH